jgi:competence protein ComEC
MWDRNIELMALTHPSEDHVHGLIEILNRYNIEQVIFPALDYSSETYTKWLNLVEEKGIECAIAQAGQQIDLGGGLFIDVLNPQDPVLKGTESDIDNNGMIIRLSMGEISFLLMADTMWEAEHELIYNRTLTKSTVLKVGHHGSDTSTTSQFLNVVSPAIAVISVGNDNIYGHPHEAVMDRLFENVDMIYRTDRNGTIEFITDGKKIWVKNGNRSPLWFY